MDIKKIKNILSASHFEIQIWLIVLELLIVFQRRYEFSILTVRIPLSFG